MAVAPLAVAVPLLTAAFMVGAGRRMPRPVADLVGLAAAVATLALCAVLLAQVWHGTHVAWMGGWHPRHHGTVVIGISLTVDPLGAGAATFAATLVVAALVYSQRYLEAVAPMYHGLMLVFLGGMVGFCVTGDLFNMFVFFELMGVPAYALTAYRIEEPGPLQGALSFAITNSIGGFMLLTGIALLYGRTGALNLAQLGQALAGHRADGLVIAATTFVLCGLLIKAAAVPFHFWLPDAHAVAPVPACVLFSGIMVPLGLLGLARVYWTVLSGVPGLAGHHLGDVLLWFGVVTAVVGAVMCFLQHHLKRLLAFSTISHTGLFLVGLATFGPHGLGAVTVFVLAHGATKAALFMAVGILGHRFGTVSERDLHGRGRARWAAGAVVALGGLALASLPPLGPFAGKALLEEAAVARGWSFVPALFVLVSALTGGAILRFGARVFLGVGRPAPPGPATAREEGRDNGSSTDRGGGRSPALLVAPMITLLVAGLCIGAVPEVRHGIDRAAALFADRPAYAAAVLRDRAAPVPHAAPASGPHGLSYAYALASVAGALASAGAALFAPWPRRRRGLQPVVDALHGWHSGHIGDDVTWAVVGIVLLGWTLAVVVR